MMFSILLAVIELTGLVGSDLRVRADFNAHNVKVGDPLELTIDFLGSANFENLHPPSLSRHVSRDDWMIDDVSARTETDKRRVGNFFASHEVAVSRTLTYRVSPIREGVLWFPELTYSYAGPDGKMRQVTANAIPVHAKKGVDFHCDVPEEDPEKPPEPDPLVTSVAGLDADTDFAWRKACAHPTAKAFAAFDFPEARLNEAWCEIRDGNWAHALSIYRALEWRTGQTPTIERGIVAALARMNNNNPGEKLPVWRQVLRPVLRYGWLGRVGIVLGGLFVLAFVFWLLGRGIRALACVAFALSVTGVCFGETVETVTTNADGTVVHRRVTTGSNGNMSFSFSSSRSSGGAMPRMANPFGGGDPFDDVFGNFDPFGRRRARQRPPVSIDVALAADKPSVIVGENFNLVLSVDLPRYVSFSDGLRLSIDEQPLLQQTGDVRNGTTVASKNPTNVIQRLIFPMRANAPLTNLHFAVSGDYVFSNERSFFRTGVPYASGGRLGRLTVTPTPAAGRPADYSGIVSEGLELVEQCDIVKVETNDVVSITYVMVPHGYVPSDFKPRDVAFELGRDGRTGRMAFRRFFVANGAATTPILTISYYDPRTKAYRQAKTAGTRLSY